MISVGFSRLYCCNMDVESRTQTIDQHALNNTGNEGKSVCWPDDYIMLQMNTFVKDDVMMWWSCDEIVMIGWSCDELVMIVWWNCDDVVIREKRKPWWRHQGFPTTGDKMGNYTRDGASHHIPSNLLSAAEWIWEISWAADNCLQLTTSLYLGQCWPVHIQVHPGTSRTSRWIPGEKWVNAPHLSSAVMPAAKK